MIRINGVKVEPTRFPDGSTQVWKLPDIPWFSLRPKAPIIIDWRFEREDEFFTVAQLRALYGNFPCVLCVPYLPYARQDKEVSNDATFALRPFAALLNSLNLEKVITWDVHNPQLTKALIPTLENKEPYRIHLDLIRDLGIKTVIFPDVGAFNRYSKSLCGTGPQHGFVIYIKKREASTGKILGIERNMKGHIAPEQDIPKGPCLIVDDICDGGATFLGIEQSMREEGIREGRDLHLFVTHGIFSKGRKTLEDAGIKLWTTNSLPRNHDGIDLERKEA